MPYDPDAEDTRRDELPLVDGRFELKQVAGSGAMGKVYLAHDRLTGQPVAVKVLAAHGGDARRFAREAAVLADLVSPAIVRYVAHGVTPNGAPYLAMEWVAGEPLNVRLGRGKLPVRDAVIVARRVGEALSLAHQHAVIHRDIKPSNVLLAGGAPQRAMLIDFGVARDASDEVDLTEAGMILGTPGYMAPELLATKAPLGPRADLYALGALLFRCIAGRLPFESDDMISLLMRIAHDDAPRLSTFVNVSPLLDELVASLVSRKPEDRPGNAELVVEILRRVEGSDGPPPLPARPPPRALGRSEQRTFSVVVGAHEGAPPPGAVRTMSEAITAFGAVVEVAVASSFTITVPRAGNAGDQAARAVQAALAVRRLLPVRLAVATGRAPGSERTQVGPVVDRAAKLLLEVRTSEIAIDELTNGLVGERFDVSSRGGPLLVHGVTDQAKPARKLLGHAAPCVGRDAELDALTAMAERCVAENASRIVLVTGPPGIGKSRLASELLSRLGERGLGFELWVGPCEAVSAGAPYSLMVRAVQRALSIPGAQLDDARKRKWLATRVGRYLPPEEAERIRELIAEMIGLPNPEPSFAIEAARRDGRLFADQLRRGLSDWLRTEAEQRPLFFLMEDLHWADRPSVKILGDVLRDLESSPVFVLALARPELRERFPKLWSGRVALEMELGGISRQASEAFARSVLSSAPADVVARVAERSSGHPLYLEELVRDVGTSADGAQDFLPETLLALVEARVAEQEVEARRVLRAGAVFGESFTDRGVDALLGGESSAEWLDVLVEREILTRLRLAPFPGTVGYRFRHGLVRDAAYATLTEEDRALGHRLAAAWLDEMGEDGFVVASHLERAGDDAGAAAKYAAEGERLLDESNLAAARDVAERALAAGSARHPALLRVVYEARRWLGEGSGAVAAAERWFEATKEGTVDRYDATSALVTAASRHGDHERGLEVTKRLLAETPEGAEATEAYVMALAMGGASLLLSGAYALGRDIAERLERLRALPGASSFRALAYESTFRAMFGVRQGFPEHGMIHFRESARSFEAIGDERSAMLAMGNVAHAFNELGDWSSAEAAARENIESAERLGVATIARYTLARAAAGLGRIAEARSTYDAATTELRAQGTRRVEAMAWGHYADLMLREGDAVTAEAHARRAIGLDPSPSARRRAEAALARALVALGRVDEAVPIARRLMDEVRGSEWAELGDVVVRLTAAVVAEAAGDPSGRAAAIAEGQALVRARAETIRDPILRRTFLEQFPDNAAMLAMNIERAP